MFWQPFGSLRQAKQRREAKRSKVKKSEDNICSILSHFWSTYRSQFSTCYIPFQSSGSQESNTSNRVRFGDEMRKIWPSEANCSKLVRNSHNTFKIRTAHAWCEFCSVFDNSTLDIFLCIFWCNFLSYPCNKPITSFCFCKDYIRGGNYLLEYMKYTYYV